ncbi:hypothetical protein [Paraburkholderia monticola]|uniref:hypothetical protein n=1 Tax=Paraburkholderia monticola TaxID=1399968 RepID=UPI0012901528|nr:hypothetical protein [Paraburkholderia monticola]
MMKSTERRTAYRDSMKSRIVMASAIALVVSGLFVSPALGANNDQHEQQQHTTNGGNHREQGHQDAHRDQHYQHDARRHGDDYSRQDYVDSPPPVVYAPDESPGISLFIPIQLR